MLHSSRIALKIFCVPILLFTLLVCAPCGGLAQGQTQNPVDRKNVLVLYSQDKAHPAHELTDQGITSSLHSGGVDVKNQFFEYLDFPPNPSPEHRKALAVLMRSRYSQHRIDMIITQYSEALQFLLNEGRTVFPEAPILAMYMFPRMELPKTGHRIIPHSPTLEFTGTLEVALKLVAGAAATRNSPSGQRKIIVRTAMLDSRTVNASVTDFGTGIDEHRLTAFSSPFTQPNPMVWAWGFPSARRSSRPMAGPWRLRTTGGRRRHLCLHAAGTPGRSVMTEEKPVVYVVDDDPSVRKALDVCCDRPAMRLRPSRRPLNFWISPTPMRRVASFLTSRCQG